MPNDFGTPANVQTNITHLLPVLTPGGAELQLARLAQDQASTGCCVSIICTRSNPGLRQRLEESGVAVHELSVHPLQSLGCLRSATVLHAWMYHGFLISSLFRLVTRCPTIWAIRRTDPDSGGLSRRTRLIVRLTQKLSARFAGGLIYCSSAAARAHRDFGFRSAHEAVIYNSVELPATASSRQRRGAPTRIGYLGRWNPDKGVDVLLEAWRQIADNVGNVKLVLAGPGLDEHNVELVALIEDLDVANTPVLSGVVEDASGFLTSLDCLVSPSRTEGFPNVVAEALAHELPVIATHVGGTPEVLGDCGSLVAPDQPDELAAALRSFVLAPDDLRVRSAAGRSRVAQLFSRESTLRATSDFYAAVAQDSRHSTES